MWMSLIAATLWKKTCEKKKQLHVGILFTFYFLVNTLNCRLCVVMLLLCGVE